MLVSQIHNVIFSSGAGGLQHSHDVHTRIRRSGSDWAQTIGEKGDLSAIVGKRLEFEPGKYAVIIADGTMGGDRSGTELVGTWTMKDGLVCRILTTSHVEPLPEDCQHFKLEGNQLEVTRNRGTGKSFTYTVI